MKSIKKIYRNFRYVVLGRKFKGINAKNHALPNFIIIGAMKSGTTSLYNYICDHPSVIAAEYDEIGFFDSNYHLGLNWYRSLFPTKKQLKSLEQKEDQGITGEDTPFYFWNEESANRIKEILPNVKLIIILRNPINRAYSEYHDKVQSGRTKKSFEQYIQSELENLKKNSPPPSKFNDDDSILLRGIYSKQFENWSSIFSKKQIIVLQSEQLLEKPQKVLNDIYNFLGLTEFNLKNKFSKKKKKYQDMNSETREILRDFYYPYNEKLFQMIEKRFDW
tara:strand:- start:314 stop:1144 length:831 start_codon:yes stop_codon:yes gene_type:complete